MRSSSAECTIASCAATEASATRLGLRALVVGLLGDGLVVHELLAAREIGLGEGEIGARLREIGAHLVERDLERPVIDDEQKIALLHHLAVGEMDLRRDSRKRASESRPNRRRRSGRHIRPDRRPCAATGVATVTVGGGGAPPCCWPWPQPARVKARPRSAAAAASRTALAMTMKSPSRIPSHQRVDSVTP